jgi:hypothetical protein
MRRLTGEAVTPLLLACTLDLLASVFHPKAARRIRVTVASFGCTDWLYAPPQNVCLTGSSEPAAESPFRAASGQHLPPRPRWLAGRLGKCS